jgi:ubiquinone/menaquinone biosynthesis C-methylase UbiE
MTPWQLWRRQARLGWREAYRGLHPCRYLEYGAALSLVSGAGRGRLLDVGAADSVFPLLCARLGMDVVAIDVDHAALRRLAASSRRVDGAGASLLRADACRLPFPDGTFRCATCVSTIEHIRNDGAVMSELARVLAPGGVCVLTIPFAGRGGARERAGALAPSGFERIYDARAVESRLVAAGRLRPVHRQAFGEASPRLMQRWEATHRYVRYLLGPAQPLVAGRLYARMPESDPRVRGLVLALAKPE